MQINSERVVWPKRAVRDFTSPILKTIIPLHVCCPALRTLQVLKIKFTVSVYLCLHKYVLQPAWSKWTVALRAQNISQLLRNIEQCNFRVYFSKAFDVVQIKLRRYIFIYTYRTTWIMKICHILEQGNMILIKIAGNHVVYVKHNFCLYKKWCSIFSECCLTFFYITLC